MKKIMNDPRDIVPEMLQGMAFTWPQLVCFPEQRVVARRKKVPKVGLVSGGGSGHEPAHAGFVGPGMLDAAVTGNIFASPSPDQMLKGIQEANNGKGVLFILKNYTGDLMNFSIAKEFAQAEGILIDSVVVKDDAATFGCEDSAGQRGIAGTILVHKAAGAIAEQGAPLEEVKRVAQKAIQRVCTMGLSLSACTLPGLDRPGFQVSDQEIELGMGIHGEHGIKTIGIRPAAELAEILMYYMLKVYNFSGKETALMVNGLGGTPLIELYVLTSELEKQFKKHNISAAKILVGNYMTSLEMAGCSVSIMDLDEELKELIGLPCTTPGLTLV